NPWKSVANVSGVLGIFSFNLCGSDPECDGSSICWKNGSESINIANPLSTLSPVLNEQTGGFSINFTGVACGRGSDSWSTTIQFKCGVSL
ncbi:putative cation-independent mannose-6-phosphate receptor, partial [Apostichopus japonicus]